MGKLVCADDADGLPVWLADGVYYKALDGMMSWATAVERASLHNYNGLAGHLATPISEAENKIVLEVTTEVRARSYIVPLKGDEIDLPKGCWLGARNTADVISSRHYQTYAGVPLYIAEQPRWSWVVGPLQRELFWLGTCHACCTDSGNIVVGLGWTAPEILVSLKCTQATDVYAYGVLVSEVYCCGVLPFDTLEDQALLTFLVESDKPISDYLDFKHTWASSPGVEQSLQAPEPLRVLIRRVRREIQH